MLKLPEAFVVVPSEVFFIATDTLANGEPVLSLTVPEICFCAKASAGKDARTIKESKKIIGFLKSCFLKNRCVGIKQCLDYRNCCTEFAVLSLIIQVTTSY